MLHNKTLLLLSPIPWDFHNRQLQLFSQKLSNNFNIVFLDTLNNKTTRLIDLMRSGNSLKKYGSFIKKLIKKRSTLIKRPVIVTIKSYNIFEEYSSIDLVLYKFQINLIALLSSRQRLFIIWAYTPIFPQILKQMKNAIWFYDFFDRIFNLESKNKDKLVRNNESWLINHSKNVFVSSSYYRKIANRILKKRHDKKIIITSTGYNLKYHLRAKPKPSTSNKIVIGYAGGISDRLDFSLTLSTIQKNPDLNFIFVGPIFKDPWLIYKKEYNISQFIKELQNFSNATIHHSRKRLKDQIRLVSGFTIGWIPYNLELAFNQFSTPTKFFEYCAIGLPVISTSLPVLKEYSNFAKFIDKPGDFQPAVNKLLAAQNDQKLISRKKFAQKHDLEQKYRQIIKILPKS